MSLRSKVAGVSPPVHLVMRFSDRLFRVGNVIERHEAVIDEKGATWVAKLGRPVGRGRTDSMNQQIDSGVATRLYLVQTKRSGIDIHRAEILRLCRGCPTDFAEMAPDYYAELGYAESAQTWVLVTHLAPVAPNMLVDVRIASSGQPLRDALRSSMSSLFFVTD